ncbi:MAG: DUF58 domain-containing protein, partial [Chloroflexota bacterium]|nr:DUF58 domain-containing protein [Chloroflexota bacterium]
RRPASGGVGGEHRSRARAPSPDFADYRQYIPGDDFRQIDWNAYGRLGHLYVKQSEAREQLAVHILLDASQSMAWGAAPATKGAPAGTPSKLGYARNLAAALAYLSLARYDRVSATALGETPRQLATVQGRGRFGTVVAFLDEVRPAGRMGLDDALAAYRVNRRLGGQAVLISDMLSPDGWQTGLDALQRAGLDVVVLHLLSPGELEPEVGGELELIDAETGEVVEVSLTAKTIAEYRTRLDRWCAEIEQFCSERAIAYVRVRTDTPLADLLLNTLRRSLILQ